MNNHYVYKHIGKTSGEIFYIGAGKGRRCYDKRHNKDWIDRVEKEGGYHIRMICCSLTKAGAMSLEQTVIDGIGIENLTNMTSNRGNKTSFKKGGEPWNKGLSNCQNYAVKKVEHDGVVYNSVNDAIDKLGIGKTTFYRWVSKNKIKYVC